MEWLWEWVAFGLAFAFTIVLVAMFEDFWK